MARLYIAEQGAMLRKTQDRLVVTKQKEILLEVPCHEVDAVLVFGNAQISTQALRELLDHGIDFSLLTRRGRLLGRLTSTLSKNAPLRRRQYERADEAGFRLLIARGIVDAKVENCGVLLRQYARNHPDTDLDGEIRSLDAAAADLGQVHDLTTLLGTEGAAARAYFAAITKVVPPAYEFHGRNRHPPADPFNALLSLGYALINTELLGALEAAGLDPYVGYYHVVDYGRPSLASDLLEEFRAPVADRLALRLVNKRVMQPQDFVASGAPRGVNLTTEALRRYFVEYERFVGKMPTRLETETTATVSADPVPAAPTWRERFHRQAAALVRSTVEDATYTPVRIQPYLSS